MKFLKSKNNLEKSMKISENQNYLLFVTTTAIASCKKKLAFIHFTSAMNARVIEK